MRVPRTKVLFAALTVSAAILAGATGTAVADTGASTDSSQTIGTSQPFLPWGDTSTYDLAPNGDFSAGLDGWSVSGDATLTAGADPFDVTGTPETQSLDLPAGSSATSPSVPIDADDPTIRFFAVNNGDPSGLLNVSVSLTGLPGTTVSLPVATISSDGTWTPSPKIWIVVNLLTLGGQMPAQFTFTPAGAGDWQIDDLYVDPWSRT